MKSILFRSIGVSLFVLCLAFSAFADGEMGTGSRSGSGGSDSGGLAPNTTIQVNTKTDDTTYDDFFDWVLKVLADVLS
jgi:hypothetical protein